MKLPKEIEKEFDEKLTGVFCSADQDGFKNYIEVDATIEEIKDFIATTLSKQEQQVRESERNIVLEEIKNTECPWGNGLGGGIPGGQYQTGWIEGKEYILKALSQPKEKRSNVKKCIFCKKELSKNQTGHSCYDPYGGSSEGTRGGQGSGGTDID